MYVLEMNPPLTYHTTFQSMYTCTNFIIRSSFSDFDEILFYNFEDMLNISWLNMMAIEVINIIIKMAQNVLNIYVKWCILIIIPT